jgi:TonB family protein
MTAPSDWLVVDLYSDVAGDQMVELNSKRLSLEDLGGVLQDLPERRLDKTLYIKGSKDKPYSEIVQAIDVVKGAGAKSIWFLIYYGQKTPKAIQPTQSVQKGSTAAPQEAPPQPGIIHESGKALQSTAINRVTPTYPPLAKAARISGAVVVEVTVDEQGNVISAQVLSGHPLLKDAAIQAVRGWKYAPAERSGVPLKVIGPITFNFPP